MAVHNYTQYLYIVISQDQCKIFLYHITMCPRSSDPFYVVTYSIKWVTTTWTYSTIGIVFARKEKVGFQACNIDAVV